MYLGDFNQNQTVNYYFTTVNGTGVPTTLANGTFRVYKNSTNTSLSTNATLTADVFGITGYNLASVDMSGNATVYASGNDFSGLLTVGDVGGTNIAGSALMQWSVNNRAGSLAADATMLSNINSTLATANTTIANANTTIGNVNTTLATANTTIANVNTTVGSINTTIATVNTNAANANTSSTSLNTTLMGANFVETNLSLKGAIRLTVASIAGQLSGANTTTMNMTNFAGNVTVISATVDSNGNRTAMTYNTSY